MSNILSKTYWDIRFFLGDDWKQCEITETLNIIPV